MGRDFASHQRGLVAESIFVQQILLHDFVVEDSKLGVVVIAVSQRDRQRIVLALIKANERRESNGPEIEELTVLEEQDIGPFRLCSNGIGNTGASMKDLDGDFLATGKDM